MFIVLFSQDYVYLSIFGSIVQVIYFLYPFSECPDAEQII